jgi:hypothetical protein
MRLNAGSGSAPRTNMDKKQTSRNFVKENYARKHLDGLPHLLHILRERLTEPI